MVVALLTSTLTIITATHPATATEDPLSFVTAWGTYGSGDGQFHSPAGVAVDGDGHVYVTDSYNDRVQKFTSNGAFLTAWGTHGTGNGQFDTPMGVAVDAGGDVFVTDYSNSRIQRFTASGTFILQWGTPGTDNGQFVAPAAVAVDTDGYVYVTDMWLNHIQKFTANGTFIRKWGGARLDGPIGVAVDRDGNVYVADTHHDQVQKFTSDGVFVTKWGATGTAGGQFAEPFGVAVGGDDNVYVDDYGNSRIQKFSSNGTFLSVWGTAGTGDGELTEAWGVAVDGVGAVFVADTGNNRVQKFWHLPRPDGRIKKGARGVYIGNDVYNATGVGQTVDGFAARGASFTYYVSVQNDARIPDRLVLDGTRSTSTYAVRYTNPAGANITSAVTAGAYTTPVLGAGAGYAVKVEVTVKTIAPIGSSLSATLTARSTIDPARRDTVKFITHRS